MMSAHGLGPYDQLLVYLSEVQAGTWERFQAAVQATVNRHSGGADLIEGTRAVLESLGHLEVAAGEDKVWSVPPGALVGSLMSHEPVAVLAGSRTHRLLVELDRLDCEWTPQQWGPSRILIRGGSEHALENLAADLGLAWSPDYSYRLATLLPSTQELWEQAPERAAPLGWAIERFSDGRWQDVASDAEDGFYRYQHFTTEYRLKWAGSCRQIDRSTGIHEFARRTGVPLVTYHPHAGVLTVPRIAGLPALAARAATMCTGLAPSQERDARGRNRLVFGNLPMRTGKLIRASLT